MNEKIAAVSDAEGNPCSFTEGSVIKVYEKIGGVWTVVDQAEIGRMDSAGIDGVRSVIKAAADRLGDCRVIAGQGLNGIPFHILDRIGFQIFTVPAFGCEVFDGITDDLNTARQDEEDGDIPLAPYSPDGDGRYYLDLIRLQERHPEISSKAALSDFVNNADFYRLEVVCRHIPPWLEGAASCRGMDCEVRSMDGGGCLVLISSRRCRTER